MIEDEASPAGGQEAESYLYDFFKHLTSLSLIALGGVLTLLQMGDKGEIDAASAAAVLGSFSLAGVIAFHGTMEIVGAKQAGARMPRYLRFYRLISPCAFGVGTGMALKMFLEVLF